MNEFSPSTLISQLLQCCGLGNFLVCGTNAQACATMLWQQNAQAVLLEENPETPDLHKLPAIIAQCAGKHDTILLCQLLDKADATFITSIAETLYRTCKRYTCVLADITHTDETGTARNTQWWEVQFLAAGFRLHPRSFDICNYGERENPPSPALLCFEKIPAEAFAAYSLKSMAKERILHMDMLREPGRRSDAHTVRYAMAAQYIRAGDTVLDCACGLGYGAHILYHNSRAKRVIGVDFSEFGIHYATKNYTIPNTIEFMQGDAQNLSTLADNSIDFIASFETIEHLPNPELYLKEMYRVLRPSGRIMLSAPDNWVDETGKDPNPHHFHVYTWEKLYKEVSSCFVPDKGFIQVAGGALKLPFGSRIWEEVPCAPTMNKEAEWVLLLAMKSPLAGANVPYQETTFPVSENPAYHVGAFYKDYANPWLLKGMISRGYRLNNEAELQKVFKEALVQSPQNSVDYGAALCGLVYQLLAGKKTQEDVASFLQRIEKYIATENPNPHAMRWKVSLLFGAALLQKTMGNLPAAEELFLRCAAYDVAPYSALLGNKTLEALYNAAMIALARGEVDLAQTRLQTALAEAERLMQGSWLNISHKISQPFEPGYPECAQLMDLAAKCCYTLGELKSTPLRPGLAWSVSKGWFEQILHNERHHTDFWKNGYYRIYNELLQRDTIITDLNAQVATCHTETTNLQTQESARHSLLADLQSQISACNAIIAGYKNSKSWKLTAPLRKMAALLREISGNPPG